MNLLLDVNVTLAATLGVHAHHDEAKRFVDGVEPPSVMLFCRVTELALLRLLTQRLGPGHEPMGNSSAIAVYAAWREDDRVGLADEPAALADQWPALARRETASTKLWADAYLAAFAIVAGFRLVTFDRGFRQFEEAGLDLELLSAS